MSWGGLNPALTSWRNGIVARFPYRGSQSDGGFADAAHGSTSQHQADADSTVDAFDCDVNFEASSIPSGNSRERAIAYALKLDFEDDPRAQLWIHQRTISSRAIDSWRWRPYTGPNPHDKHIHFETKQSRERDGRAWKMPRTDALIGWDDMTQDELLDALESPRGQALIAKAAGRGVHNQELFRSGVTIGTAVQTTGRDVAEIKASLPPVDPA